MRLEGLRYAREQVGYSQQELADKSGVSQHTISELELRRRKPQGRTLRKLAEVLGVEVANLRGVPGPMQDLKRCRVCGLYKRPDGFHKHPGTGDGLQPYCKDCRKSYWNDGQRWRDMFRLYGLTKEDYLAMQDTQGGVCAVCGKPCERGELSVDHDHESGRVRGLLCRYCNTGLGSFRDDPALLTSAAEYLRSHSRS